MSPITPEFLHQLSFTTNPNRLSSAVSSSEISSCSHVGRGRCVPWIETAYVTATPYRTFSPCAQGFRHAERFLAGVTVSMQVCLVCCAACPVYQNVGESSLDWDK